MARGDDLINLIIALADMVGSVAKNMKKILAIIRKKSKGIKKPIIKTETINNTIPITFRTDISNLS